MARRGIFGALHAFLLLQVVFAGVLVCGSPVRTGGSIHHRRSLNAANSTTVATPSSSQTSAAKEELLVGKLVLTITIQADFSPLQDEAAYQTFRDSVQQSIAKVVRVPSADVEIASLTPGSVVVLALVSFYSATDEDKARVLMSGFAANPTSALTKDFQEAKGTVSSASSRWIKARVLGQAPGLGDSQMMGIWIAVAMAIAAALVAIFLTLRVRYGWCQTEELANHKFDPRDLPVPLSIASRRITSQDTDMAKVAPQQQQPPLQRKTSGAGANAPGKPPLPRGPSGNHNKLAGSKSTAGADAAEAIEAKQRVSGAGAEPAPAAADAPSAPAAAEEKDFKLKSAPGNTDASA